MRTMNCRPLCRGLSGRLLICGLLAVGISGCGGSGVAGGTTGTLRIDGRGLPEIQLRLYQARADDFVEAGFGVTVADGRFELLQPAARGALWLSPGDYRVTLESIGPPLQIPAEFQQPATTPVILTVDPGQESIELDVNLKTRK